MTLPLAPVLVSQYLSDDDTALMQHLLARVDARRERNAFLSRMYDGKQLVRSLGVAVNPQFDNLQTVVGWPGTVVDALNERRSVDHVEVASSAAQTDLIQGVWDDNDLDVEMAMSRDDQSIHGISFVVVARKGGRTIVLPTPATRMTCEYDRSVRRITSAASRDGKNPWEPNAQATLYTPAATTTVEVDGGRYKVLERFANPLGIVPVERFVNRPRHDRPWGNSEITPAVISYTNAAVRTLVSMEVAREFFAAPQRYALNIDPDAFTDSQGNEIPAWQTYWGKFIALSGAPDDDGNALEPSLNQLPASSPQPMVDLLKMLSQMMTAETRMPPSLWGFVTDNPASGDGARMYENGLVLKAKARNRFDSGPLSRMGKLILLAEGESLDALPPRVESVWSDPATYTPSAMSDAITKQVSAGVLSADSDVTREQLGYDREQSKRIAQDLRKVNAGGVVAALAALAKPAPVVTSADTAAVPAVPAG